MLGMLGYDHGSGFVRGYDLTMYFGSLPVGMTDGGFYSNWYMPFNQAQIEFKNEGKTAYTLDFQIHHAP